MMASSHRPSFRAILKSDLGVCDPAVPLSTLSESEDVRRSRFCSGEIAHLHLTKRGISGGAEGRSQPDGQPSGRLYTSPVVALQDEEHLRELAVAGSVVLAGLEERCWNHCQRQKSPLLLRHQVGELAATSPVRCRSVRRSSAVPDVVARHLSEPVIRPIHASRPRIIAFRGNCDEPERPTAVLVAATRRPCRRCSCAVQKDPGSPPACLRSWNK